MNKQLTFRNMEPSPTIEEHVNRQLSKVEKFLEHEKGPIFIHIVLTSQFIHKHHNVEVQLTTPLYKMHVQKEGPDFYLLISEVMDLLYERLTEAKRKNVDKWQSGPKPEISED